MDLMPVLSALTVVRLALAAVVAVQLTHAPSRYGAAKNPKLPAAVADELASLKVIPTRPYVIGCGRGTKEFRVCAFGQPWSDDTSAAGGHNGCDTRNDVLKAQLAGATFKPGTRDCVVLTGILDDPYTGRTIAFSRQRAALVQIDHVVPLALAWDLGADRWTAAQRAAYANDESLVLLAVDGKSNEAKGDSGLSWLPPNQAFTCAYVTRFVTILARYRLAITTADKAAATSVLNHCPPGA